VGFGPPALPGRVREVILSIADPAGQNNIERRRIYD